MDQQVKIRGFRVEPGEIEAVLRLHPSVRDAVVVPDRSVGDTRLTGYYVPSQVPASGTAPTQAALRSWLAERLPDYYVPTFLIPVESFPLGSTGKVNPSALPAHGAESRTERYQAPRSTIEHELLQIWERLLRPSGRLGVFDDFFERGGHSLLAIQMITEVQRIRGQRIPLSWLFESSTIATLAARLSTAQVSEEAALVVLQREQPGAPIAFIHGDWTGGGWYVRRLAPLIAPEAPVFVLPTVGEGDASTPWSIERIAARHVAELRTVQPRGPYRLIGYCISGVIAYEMACQLVAAGEQVDKLIVVDGAPMNARLTGWRPLIGAIPDWFERRLALQRAVLGRLRWIDLQLRRLRKRSIPGSTAWALRAIGRRTPLRGLFRLAAPDPGPVPDSREGLDQDAIVGRVQQQAAEAYLPRPYSGILDFLWAAGAPGGYTRSNPIERWRPLAREVRLHSIESGHIGLITENLHLFAEALREVLERRP